jgi:hypothetical protein
MLFVTTTRTQEFLGAPEHLPSGKGNAYDGAAHGIYWHPIHEGIFFYVGIGQRAFIPSSTSNGQKIRLVCATQMRRIECSP